MATEPFRIVIRQGARVIARREVLPGTAVAYTWDTNSTTKRSSAASTGQLEDLLILSVNELFHVLLYRHRNNIQLASGFWHTEYLDGRHRIGNEIDRSPRAVASEHAQEFPFEQKSDPLAEAAGPNYIFCGCLQQKVSRCKGRYTIRISPMLKQSHTDYLFPMDYKGVPLLEELSLESKVDAELGEAERNEPGSVCAEPTPVIVRTPRATRNLPEHARRRSLMQSSHSPIAISQKRKLFSDLEVDTAMEELESPSKRSRAAGSFKQTVQHNRGPAACLIEPRREQGPIQSLNQHLADARIQKLQKAGSV